MILGDVREWSRALSRRSRQWPGDVGEGSRWRDRRDPSRVAAGSGVGSDVSWAAGSARRGQLEDEICQPD
jgi:hypothetical protein